MSAQQNLFSTLRAIVREEVARVRTAELAVVEAVHPHADESDSDNYACSVALRDSGIVLKQVPVATQRIGCAAIPAVGELVLVQFIGGNINAPVITGRLYNNEDRPPPNQENQAVMHLPLTADDADAVHVELNSGDNRALTVKLGNGLEIVLQDDDPVVEIKADSDKALVSIARDGTVSIESQSDIAVNSGGNIELSASGDINLSGATINLN